MCVWKFTPLSTPRSPPVFRTRPRTHTRATMESLFSLRPRRAETQASREAGLDADAARVRRVTAHQVELRKARRDRASQHLTEALRTLTEVTTATEAKLPPGFVRDTTGALGYMGGAQTAYALLTGGEVTYGLTALRLYFARPALGPQQLPIAQAEALVAALHACLATPAHTQPACVVLGLLASKHVAFSLAMQEHVLPALAALLVRREPTPTPVLVSALLVLQNVAHYQPDLVAPHTDALEHVLRACPAAEVRVHAASTLHYLCLPMHDVCERGAAAEMTYERTQLPRLWELAAATLADTEPEARGFALSAIARLARGRPDALDRLTQVGTMASVAQQLHALPTDVLEVFDVILESPATRHCAAVLPYLPRLWLVAETQPTRTPAVCRLLFQVCADVDPEAAAAVFLTLFPNAATVPAVAEHVRAHGGTEGAEMLALLWRRVAGAHREALRLIFPLLCAAVRDEERASISTRACCLETLILMVEHDARRGGARRQRAIAEAEFAEFAEWLADPARLREHHVVRVRVRRLRALLVPPPSQTDDDAAAPAGSTPWDV